MRTIKFRAWDKITGKFVSMQDIEVWSCADPVYNSWTVRSAPNTEIMQFTGLKDKNGKEIYEGDILQSKNWYEDSKGQTILSDKNSYMEKCVVEFNKKKVFQGYSIGENDEIIGNIYESPELLQDKQKEIEG